MNEDEIAQQERREHARFLRLLADKVEAGRVYGLGVAGIENCDDPDCKIGHTFTSHIAVGPDMTQIDAMVSLLGATELLSAQVMDGYYESRQFTNKRGGGPTRSV